MCALSRMSSSLDSTRSSSCIYLVGGHLVLDLVAYGSLRFWTFLNRLFCVSIAHAELAFGGVCGGWFIRIGVISSVWVSIGPRCVFILLRW